jgi:hypothetical protein
MPIQTMKRLIPLLAILALVGGCATVPSPSPPKKYGFNPNGLNTTTLIAQTAISGTTPIKSSWVPLSQGATALSFELVTDGTVSGSWKFEVTDKPGVASGIADDTSPSDVTSGFQVPAGTAIAAAAGSPTSQFVQTIQVGVVAGAIRLTFTPSGGAGNVVAYANL